MQFNHQIRNKRLVFDPQPDPLKILSQAVTQGLLLHSELATIYPAEKFRFFKTEFSDQ